MYRTENSKERCSNSGRISRRSRQEGSILIGLIITMVIMAFLGAGMVYLTTTSTFQELFANNHLRAYYAAESGGRYTNSLIRQYLAAGTPPPQSAIVGKFTLANNDQFEIANWHPFSVPVGAGFTNYYIYDSIGTVGSGFLQAKRKISYKIHPADQSTLPVDPPIPEVASDFNVKEQDLGNYYDPAAAADTQIAYKTVGDDNALIIKADSYTMGIKWYSDTASFAKLDTIRALNGGHLSYGVQIKILEGDEDDNPANVSPYNIFGVSFRLDGQNDGNTNNDYDNMYGISFVKLTKPLSVGTSDPDWYRFYIFNNSNWDLFSTGNNAGEWFVVLWKRICDTGSIDNKNVWVWDNHTGIYEPLAYYQILQSDPVCDGVSDGTGCAKLKHWSTIMGYVEETGTNPNEINKFTGYLASPDAASYPYPRRTNTNSEPIRWPGEWPNYFQQINWTVVTNSGATGTDIIQDGSLTASNIAGFPYGTTGTTRKAREIGFHNLTGSQASQQIYYDNFYIDLSPSGYGYVPGSGQVITGP